MMRRWMVCLVAVLLWPSVASAQWAVGMGYQYGGLLGGKYIYDLDEANKLNVALSPVGGAFGYQRNMDGDKGQHALGVSIGMETMFQSDHGFAVATYNYYPAGFQKSSWTMGVDAGIYNAGPRCELYYCPDNKVGPALFFNLGYQF
ncbi:hypothetical protein KUV89_11695 [Marinobacter hydrocarbonoclasticus]|nr:hypothetical protein [Marinobacter nauticus]